MSEEQSSSQSFFSSLPFLVIVSVLLPPIGLFLLWMRQDTNTNLKLLCSALILSVGAGYFVLAYFIYTRNFGEDARYTALEQHREQQRQQYGNQPVSQDTNQTGQPSLPDANTQVQTTQPNGQTPPNSTPSTNNTRNYWTDFRGANRDGSYQETAIKTDWANLQPAWKQPLGGGWASFVIENGRAYTIEQRRAQETVTAYDVQTGREIWTNSWNAEFRESMGGDGPRATPTYHEGKVYALGATGEFRAIDAKTGKTLWGKNILSEAGASNLQWAMSAAPLVVDDKVIVQPGGKNNSSVVAYNKNTGATVWKSLSDEASYTSPMLVNLAGRKQIMTVTKDRAVGLAPENGTLLWDYSWTNSYGINISQPIVVSANRVFISAGYGKGAALFEVSGSGNSFSAKTIWENNNMKNKFQSSVLYNGYVYGLDEGILTCLDVNTGERKWKGGRYGYGQLILASGHLIVITEEGNLVLVKAAPDKHTEVAQIPALQGRSWNVPAMANGKLLIRNGTEMACYNIGL